MNEDYNDGNEQGIVNVHSSLRKLKVSVFKNLNMECSEETCSFDLSIDRKEQTATILVGGKLKDSETGELLPITGRFKYSPLHVDSFQFKSTYPIDDNTVQMIKEFFTQNVRNIFKYKILRCPDVNSQQYQNFKHIISLLDSKKINKTTLVNIDELQNEIVLIKGYNNIDYIVRDMFNNDELLSSIKSLTGDFLFVIYMVICNYEDIIRDYNIEIVNPGGGYIDNKTTKEII